MAEFCVDCWNKIFDTQYAEKWLVMSKEKTICEDCQQMKFYVVTTKADRWKRRLYWLIFPFDFVYQWVRYFAALPRLRREARERAEKEPYRNE